MSLYPTSEYIMANEMKFKVGTLQAVKAWKAEHFRGWKNKAAEEKMAALNALVDSLGLVYANPVGFRADKDSFDHYNRASKVITLANPSIITALHEFAHHLGRDEFGACRWSVWLFKKVFPKSFAKLRFAPGSHMLVRRETLPRH